LLLCCLLLLSQESPKELEKAERKKTTEAKEGRTQIRVLSKGQKENERIRKYDLKCCSFHSIEKYLEVIVVDLSVI
jgi:hypothetical protein